MKYAAFVRGQGTPVTLVVRFGDLRILTEAVRY